MESSVKMFFCIRDGLQIRGAQYVPEGFSEKEKYPVIIISHGFNGNYTETRNVCNRFTKLGYVAIGYSFCGGSANGTSAELISDGNTTDMTIESEVQDLITVKNYVKTLPYIDTDKIVLLGFSQGGFVSGLAAARCGSEIYKLIMVYPALCIPDHSRMGCLGGASYDPQNVPDVICTPFMKLGKCFSDGVVNLDPYLELTKYKGPVLILQGLQDNVVNYSYAIRAKESYAPGQAQLLLIRDTGHGFNESQEDSAVCAMKQFLNDRKEIFSIRIMVTHVETEVVQDGNLTINKVYFTGFCESPAFTATIMSEGCDTQEYANGKPPKLHAVYTLEGIDRKGAKCYMNVDNQSNGEDWKPVVKTNCEELLWMNTADLTAVLEFSGGGPTVRIFAYPQ